MILNFRGLKCLRSYDTKRIMTPEKFQDFLETGLWSGPRGFQLAFSRTEVQCTLH